MKEIISMNHQDTEALAVKLSSGDLSGVKMTGQSIDRIYKNGVLVNEVVGHNLVVNSIVKLLMCLLKKHSGYSGIQYWAVGSGASSWDSTPVSPVADANSLTSEIGRVAISPEEIKFLDSNYEESSTPTNIIQISHTFNSEDCNGTWREFGLFGGNATSTKGSGIMINKRHHSVLTKTEEMTVERIMIFTLSLV